MTTTTSNASTTTVDRSTDTTFISEVTLVTEYSAETAMVAVGDTGTEWRRKDGTEVYPSNGDVHLVVIGKQYRNEECTEHTRETFRVSPQHARALATQLLAVANMADAER